MRSIVDIENLTPTGHGDLWTGTLAVRIHDEIDGLRVDQVIQITVRVSQKDEEPIETLLQSVYDRARNILASASGVLENNTIQELRELQRQRSAELAQFSRKK